MLPSHSFKWVKIKGARSSKKVDGQWSSGWDLNCRLVLDRKHLFSSKFLNKPLTASAKVDLKTKKLPRCRPCPHENLGNFQCNMWFWKNFSGKNQGFWFFENSDKVLLKLIQKLYIEIFHIQDGAFFKTDETVYLWM